MRNVRNLALASGAVIALAFGGVALAQETKQPQQKHEHGDAEHAKNHAEHMQRMHKKHERMHEKHEKEHGEQAQPEKQPG
jgi:hypothetical protein